MSHLYEYIARRTKEMQAEEEIRCPGCFYLFDPEDRIGLVTYHGDAGPQDAECPECEALLAVTEAVRRTYKVVISGNE